MKQASGRSAVFLEEMGVGPLWSLRCGTTEFDAPAAQPQQEPPQIAAPAAQVMAAEVPEPQAVAQPAGSAVDDSSTAWFDDAPAPPPVQVTDEAIAAMDWNELKAAAAKCTRCDLCRGRKGSVFGRGDRNADWLLVGSAPNRADEKETRPVSGDAGKLLDNMLLAIGLAPDSNVYVTNLVKCRPVDGSGAERAPAPAEVLACRPYLEREIALTQGRTMLTLGQAAASGLLGPAAASRGSVRHLGQLAVVATYHPDDLLGQGPAKARAWGDLCLAKKTHAGPG